MDLGKQLLVYCKGVEFKPIVGFAFSIQEDGWSCGPIPYWAFVEEFEANASHGFLLGGVMCCFLLNLLNTKIEIFCIRCVMKAYKIANKMPHQENCTFLKRKFNYGSFPLLVPPVYFWKIYPWIFFNSD